MAFPSVFLLWLCGVPLLSLGCNAFRAFRTFVLGFGFSVISMALSLCVCLSVCLSVSLSQWYTISFLLLSRSFGGVYASDSCRHGLKLKAFYTRMQLITELSWSTEPSVEWGRGFLEVLKGFCRLTSDFYLGQITDNEKHMQKTSDRHGLACFFLPQIILSAAAQPFITLAFNCFLSFLSFFLFAPIVRS